MAETTYTIPLRQETAKAPTKKKAKKAVTAIKEYLVRHTKVTNVKLGAELNEAVWSRGIEKPPAKVTVAVRKHNDMLIANLVGKSLDPKVIEQKQKQDDKNLLERQLDKVKGSPASEEKKSSENASKDVV